MRSLSLLLACLATAAQVRTLTDGVCHPHTSTVTVGLKACPAVASRAHSHRVDVDANRARARAKGALNIITLRPHPDVAKRVSLCNTVLLL